jgi:hypothetical protein
LTLAVKGLPVPRSKPPRRSDTRPKARSRGGLPCRMMPCVCRRPAHCSRDVMSASVGQVRPTAGGRCCAAGLSRGDRCGSQEAHLSTMATDTPGGGLLLASGNGRQRVTWNGSGSERAACARCVCAVQRHSVPVDENPTQPRPPQPEATGAVEQADEAEQRFGVEGHPGRLGECAAAT